MAASVAQVFKAQDAKTETVETSNGGKVTVATSSSSAGWRSRPTSCPR